MTFRDAFLHLKLSNASITTTNLPLSMSADAFLRGMEGVCLKGI